MSNTLEVLLVEDSKADVRLAQEALSEVGLPTNVTVVNDGEQALDYLRRAERQQELRRPDLILLDLNMPKVNGHEVLDEMRGMVEYKETPVILLTTSNCDEDIQKAHGLGMNYYLRKPVQPERLEPLLDAIRFLWA